ncbi:hypothetical protein TPHA_0B01520 [Tetrapisispora phaffii CBS 4417]|uniref:Protein kinase C-like 1 n=1 Tax=Tetrapisispora phaffii (strain ATCC 24235 / CBS 4417 / NBRC 1672 / NRRL Y-8282 / UCD 70-5) TaxID=1071381 RepID=G8BP94_TETPH|nr:hypothetical protein TPHA_0B01520 [Tetrapisispora phaffii CBS 4417]CCE61825.1 hypothetical protein TPHA_0B01520 [Tetrapisispora phaffii CBS 4417]
MYSNIQAEIHKKLEREKNIIQGASNLKKKTDNAMVVQKCNTNIREARQNIEYLEDQLRKIEISASKAQNNSSSSKDQNRMSTINQNEHVFSRLDLVKYDCPSLSQRIEYMLQQLEFKLQVERQYQEANAKLTKLYQIDGDTRSSTAAEGGVVESKNRIKLLTKILKKYQAINVDFTQLESSDDLNNVQPKFRRKQQVGTLNIAISAIRDVDHIQSPMFSKKPESYIIIKIDDVIKARSKFTRTDRWNDVFNIPVEKGNEVEIVIYDKMNDTIMPVAIMWFLLSDIVEEIRKKKVDHSSQQQGWVNASRLMSGSASSGTPAGQSRLQMGSNSINSDINGRSPYGNDNSSSTVSESASGPVTIDSWFVLEPAGQVLVSLGFDKTQPLATSALGGLHRQGAIINRKEEVFEQHGHHFVQKSFYNIMCCAYCGDFLRYTGFQCQDCKFLCHKKCYSNVVTKCIAKSDLDSDPDEAKLNHHIPHRFEPASNLGTKWCCHCGYILPWGKHKVRKCSECGIMCHSQCAHLVPDFCGMSMEMANTILKTIQDTKRTQAQRKKQMSMMGSNVNVEKNKNRDQIKKIATSPMKQTGRQEDELRQYRTNPLPVAPYSATKQKTNDSSAWDEASKSASGYPSLQGNISTTNNNDTYNNFTADAGNNVSPDMKTNMLKNFTQPNNNDPYHNNGDQWQTKQESIAEENRLWNQQRIDMDNELKLDSQQHRKSQIQEIIPDNIMDDIKAGTISLNTVQDEAIMKPIEKSSTNSTNPFREMDKETFNSEKRISAVKDDGSEMTYSPKNASITASPQKSTASGRHKKKGPKRRKVSLDDFILLKVLGKGNFGKVLLSKSKNTGRVCAIKVLKKDHIIQNHDIASARAEKKVFLLATKTKHPFLTNLYCSFQTENRIYFAMEFIGGGDLMWHVQNDRLSVRRAKIYAAEVLLALKYFHDNGVIYRDLKLENILLTPEGHIKIADYGLCKDEMWYGNTTSTFCGTPEFMAPEILKEQAYTRAVDWWAYGILLYQMLLCQSPFSGDDEDEVFNAILSDEPLYPIDMAGDIVQIFQGLLTKDPTKRLGAGPRDALEIMEEPFFHNINFDDVINLRIEPPYIPKISSPEDTSYFEQEFTSAPPTLTPLPSLLTTSQQEEFRGFSFMPNDLEL